MCVLPELHMDGQQVLGMFLMRKQTTQHNT
uniref:Uncharacterized protein n=1 Tax=Myoviridae sp. ctu6J18 TaxID=2827714 RepID=A0A8S5TN07_9CAUD|nr:MAG TPA: hypothetical protein [Myoviridae sp. ctu6J18]